MLRSARRGRRRDDRRRRWWRQTRSSVYLLLNVSITILLEGPSITEPGHRHSYFAYGSNLCLEDFAVFCREHGFAVDCLRVVGTATLEGAELVFDRLSKRRGGGVLNIRAQAGSHVEGVLFEPTAGGWSALDLKEGHPLRYRRETVRVTLADGTDVEATIYRGRAMASFVAPTADYVEICRRGRAAFGLDTVVVDVAARTDLQG